MQKIRYLVPLALLVIVSILIWLRLPSNDEDSPAAVIKEQARIIFANATKEKTARKANMPNDEIRLEDFLPHSPRLRENPEQIRKNLNAIDTHMLIEALSLPSDIYRWQQILAMLAATKDPDLASKTIREFILRKEEVGRENNRANFDYHYQKVDSLKFLGITNTKLDQEFLRAAATENGAREVCRLWQNDIQYDRDVIFDDYVRLIIRIRGSALEGLAATGEASDRKLIKKLHVGLRKSLPQNPRQNASHDYDLHGYTGTALAIADYIDEYGLESYKRMLVSGQGHDLLTNFAAHYSLRNNR